MSSSPESTARRASSASPAPPVQEIQYILSYGYTFDGIQPHECLYDLTERGSFTHVFTNSGLDLQDPIAIRFGSERKWRFTHVECLIDVPFRFPQGIDIIWVKWGLRDLVALEAYANEEDIENPKWPDPEEIWAARLSGFHSI